MIRSARPDEADTLLVIQREACVEAFPHIYPPEQYPFPDDGVREVWQKALADPDIEAYVAEEDGDTVGCVAVGGVFLRNLYVVPERWKSGVGSALHDLALERLRERGCGEAKLWTLEQNWTARRFYEKRGWTLNGETRVVPFPPNPTDVGYSKTL
jgi:GNAT superfamily N-acetyltransferase